MVLGAEVFHKKFGNGVIVGIDQNNYVYVKFSAGEKMFQFSAFPNGNLSLRYS
ncbi:MAG: hypothetical protein IJR61_03445 [Clostridia bacterium]|nr:hypothetical protein [Clostridia bacterium]